jgi:hypothetical protein
MLGILLNIFHQRQPGRSFLVCDSLFELLSALSADAPVVITRTWPSPLPPSCPDLLVSLAVFATR